jgi:hypothetical protein
VTIWCVNEPTANGDLNVHLFESRAEAESFAGDSTPAGAVYAIDHSAVA